MKLLLDNNIPKKLKLDFPEHEVFTAREMGWSQNSNGELLDLLIQRKFDALVTFDKNLQYQQNFKRYPIAVLVLVASSNEYPFLENLIPELRRTLKRRLKPGCHYIRARR